MWQARYGFEQFDPLNGHLPDRYFYQFINVINRARQLLDGRTSEEIQIGAKVLSGLYDAPGFVHPGHTDLNARAVPVVLPGGEQCELLPYSDEVDVLVHNIDGVVLPESVGCKKFGWAEIFAIQSLYFVESLMATIHKSQQQLPSWYPEITQEKLDEYAHEFSILANKAIVQAESIVRLSEQNRKAANHRHVNKTGALKETVTRLYFVHHAARSARDAASRILKELIDSGAVLINNNILHFEGKEVLRTDDPGHRFEKWIGEAKRKTQSRQL